MKEQRDLVTKSYTSHHVLQLSTIRPRALLSNFLLLSCASGVQQQIDRLRTSPVSVFFVLRAKRAGSPSLSRCLSLVYIFNSYVDLVGALAFDPFKI